MSIKSLFEDIADAIREKSGSSDSYTPSEMPGAIRSIPSGSSTAIGVTYDNTASGLTANNVQGAIDELAWNVTTINSDLSELETYVAKNNFPALGSSEIINLAQTVPQTFVVPCDGYVNVVASASGSALVYIMGANGDNPSNSASVTLVASPGSPIANQNSAFVKKGMKVRTQAGYTGASMTFMPLK